MPWQARDAHKYKKGLSPKQARQWSHVANSVMQKCMADGGKESDCAGSAIQQANGAVGKPKMAEATTMRRLTIHSAVTVPPTRLTLHQREYLTAPAVLIVEGVLNGGFISGESLIAQDWNSIPLTIGHPQDAQGQPVSARSPEVLATYGVGHIYRAQVNEGQRAGLPAARLQAELWLDLAQVEHCGRQAQQALAMLEAQEPLEVSTGFFCTAIPARGSAYGVPYTEVLTGLRPDHLALLPNSIGACSWESGCGAGRLNAAACGCADPTDCQCHAEEEPMPLDTPSVPRLQRFWQMVQAFFHEDHAAQIVPDEPDEPEEEDGTEEPDTDETEEAETEAETILATQADATLTVAQTDTDLRDALMGCLVRESMDSGDMPMMWIEAVDAANQFFVYHCGQRLCRRYWQEVNGVITLLPTEEDVQRQTDFVTVPGTTTSDTTEGGDTPMAMQQPPPVTIKMRVNRLIANAAQTGWTEEDRHFLEGQDEAFLIRLEHQPRVIPPVEQHEPTTMAEALQLVPAQFRETLSNATQAYERRKRKLIETLANHSQNPFSKDELEAMTSDRLEQLVVMAGEELPDEHPRTNAQQQSYAGRRVPQLRIVNAEEDTVPAPPNTMDRVIERQREMGLRA